MPLAQERRHFKVVEAIGFLLRAGRLLQPVVLVDPPRTAKVWCEEVFGPVVAVAKVGSFDDALKLANDSAYGLQAGLFTSDIHKVLEAWDHLDVGGVVVNDVSSYRVDNMPYGGVKESGLGREGVRFAIEDMTEIRLMVLKL